MSRMHTSVLVVLALSSAARALRAQSTSVLADASGTGTAVPANCALRSAAESVANVECIAVAKALPQEGGIAGTPEGASPGDPPFTYVQPIVTRNEVRPMVDATTGALVYHHSLRLPPGRRGMTPNLSLVYNSQATQEEYVTGFGWSFEAPYIERLNLRGSDTFYGGVSTDFVSSLWGELAHVSGNAYGLLTETGTRIDLTYTGGSDGSWTARMPDGSVHTFGASTGAFGGRQFDPNFMTRVFRWNLEQSVDALGNAIDYAYDHSDGQVYLQEILYTVGPGSAPPAFSIRFEYDNPRPDLMTSNRRGFAVMTKRRLREIRVTRNDTGALITSYALGYVQDSRNNRSLLTSITETGFDESGQPTANPPTTFTYTSDNFGFHPVTPVDTPEIWADAHDLGIIFVDVDGDAYPDAIKATKYDIPPFTETRATYKNISYQSSTPNFEYPYLSALSNWVPPEFICHVINGPAGTPVGDAQGVVVTDLNGDARPDFILAGSGAPPASHVHENSGGGWIQAASWDGTVQPLDPTYTGFRPHFGDVNGDGLPDVIQALGGFVTDVNAYKNLGNAFALGLFFSSSTLQNGTGLRVLDLDHDGRTDVLQSSDTAGQFVLPNTNYAFTNMGNAFGGFTLPSPLPLFETASTGVEQALFADVNSDHLPDFIDRQGWIWLHSGTTWIQTNLNFDPNAIVDLNGDTLPDLIVNTCLWVPNQQCWTSVYYNAGHVPDLLQSITLPTGGITTVEYKSSAQYVSGPFLLNPNLPFPVMTVERVTKLDPVSGVSGTTTYTYAGGSYFFGGPFDRRFAGFEKVTERRPDGSRIETYFHQGNSSNAAHDEVADHRSKIGRVFQVEIVSSTGNLMERTRTKWDFVPLPSASGNRFFAFAAEELRADYDANATAKGQATTYLYDPVTGNLIQRTDLGEVDILDPTTWSDTGTDLVTSEYTYTTAAGMRLPARVRVTDAGGVVSETVRYYDGLPVGQVQFGNLTREERLVSGTSCASGVCAATTRTYDGVFGLVLEERDANGNPTTYTYDPLSLYAATVANALGHTSQFVYDYSLGKPRQTTEPTGAVRTTVFDGLDRPVAELGPDPETGYEVEIRHVLYDSSLRWTATIDNLSGTLAVESTTYVDGFGRTIQVRERVENQGGFAAYVVRDTTYSEMGRVATTSLPYFSNITGATPPTGDPALLASFEHDALGRVLTETTAVGVTATTYDDWKTSITDPAGNAKDLIRDAYGRLVEVHEYAGTGVYTTAYQHDSLGNLVLLTDALSNVRGFAYDRLSRRLSAEDLHAPGDTTYGTYVFEYDLAGNLTKRTTPNNVVVTLSYDALNRIVTEDAVGTPGFEATYTYDFPPYGIGRRRSAVNAAASVVYSYDAAGYLRSETKTIAGTSYDTSYGRDFEGNEVSITNPDNSEVLYTRNIAGFVESVAYREASTSTFEPIVTNIDYGPTGAETLVENANGTRVVSTFDDAELYRLRERCLEFGGSRVHTATYAYDPVGNVLSVAETSANGSALKAYGYDPFSRLTSANVAGSTAANTYVELFTYNAVGNMQSGPTGTYLYQGNQGSSYANPHAATVIGGTPIIYDRSGNVLTDGTRVNTWDYRNLLVETEVP